MIIKKRIIPFLMLISTVLIANFFLFEVAASAGNAEIIIDENLKPGMALKDAIELLGPPETIKVSNEDTIIIPYNTLGLSIEVISGDNLIKGIHIQSSFKGRFASGIKIGAGIQKVLSAYNQPEVMTEEIIEYPDMARSFKIHSGKLAGAEIYSEKSTVDQQGTGKVVKKNQEVEQKVREKVREDVQEEEHEEVREALREEIREEVREEIREEVIDEINKELDEEINVFDLYGIKVKRTFKGVIITEIRPGSVAESGGLKVGEPIRKVFYKGTIKLNIYSVSGLKSVLQRAVEKRKKTVNILQSDNHYYIVEVPKRM